MSTTNEQQIYQLLIENLQIISLKIINNSSLHDNHISSPKNGDSHFHLLIQAKDFDNLNNLQSQRLVYKILNPVMLQIHAISMEISHSH